MAAITPRHTAFGRSSPVNAILKSNVAAPTVQKSEYAAKPYGEDIWQ
ncbi:MAG: hypothetical protein ACOYIF_05825 [Acetivibrionales bacterium]